MRKRKKLPKPERAGVKGVRPIQKRTCHGCMALTASSRGEVVWPVGLMDPHTPDSELRRRGLFGKCDLGFPQCWRDWGFAVPLKPCPKPAVSSKQAGRLYGVLRGKNVNIWDCINDVREIIDILKSETPELLDATFIEVKLANIDYIFMKLAKIMKIPYPKGFVLKKWNASIGPYYNYD